MSEAALPLPSNYRRADILSFHGRDSQSVSERVSGNTLQKGMLWHGKPALLSISLQTGFAKVELQVDDIQPRTDDAATLTAVARRMLGLSQDIEQFETAHGDHPVVGAMIRQQSGLRVPVCASPFEALSWAITGQQISLAAALSLRRKLIRQADIRHSCGLYCYPDAHHLAGMDNDTFRLAGISQGKAAALLAISRAVLEQHLPLEAWLHAPAGLFPDISATLRSIKGIGPWTINYTLLRGYAWLDGSLHGDAAVRRAIRTLMQSEPSLQANELTEKSAESWLQPFSPWRALLAAHLWQWQSGVSVKQ